MIYGWNLTAADLPAQLCLVNIEIPIKRKSDRITVVNQQHFALKQKVLNARCRTSKQIFIDVSLLIKIFQEKNNRPLFPGRFLIFIYIRVANSRLGHYSENQLFPKRSKYIDIKFLLYKQSENPWDVTKGDVLLFATLWLTNNSQTLPIWSIIFNLSNQVQSYSIMCNNV